MSYGAALRIGMLRDRYRDWRRRLELRLARRESLKQTFERIYEKRAWGSGTPSSSGSGSSGPWADAFVEFVAALAESGEFPTALDIGCGDFSVGSRICGWFQHYEAVDIAEGVIAENLRRYADAEHVRFSARDACKDELPAASLVLVRQVLQHLTNAQIVDLIDNIAALEPSLVVFAEHCAKGAAKKPNVDLPRQSEHTRAIYGSGVLLDAHPFRLDVRLARRVVDAASPADELLIWTWRGRGR